MTGQELREWLGVSEDAPLRPEVIEGMAGVPVPSDDAGHLAAFTAFLACSGAPPLAPKRIRDHPR